MTDAKVVAALIAATTGLVAVSPSPHLGFLLQATGLGGLVGGLVAYRARRRGLDVDQPTIIARYTAVGAILALLIIAMDAVR